MSTCQPDPACLNKVGDGSGLFIGADLVRNVASPAPALLEVRRVLREKSSAGHSPGRPVSHC